MSGRSSAPLPSPDNRAITLEMIDAAMVAIEKGHQDRMAERAAARRLLHELYDVEKAPHWVQLLLLGADTPIVSATLAARCQQELDKVRR